MSDDALMGDYIVNEDGSMDRLMPVPEAVRKEAEKRGIKLKPDHIPADEVQRYTSLQKRSTQSDMSK